MLNILKLKKNNVNNDIIFSNGDTLKKNTRHYPPATKEWYNSIYSFNKNTTKSLPSSDVYVTKMIKSYFNLFNLNFEKKSKIPIIRFKKRRLKMNKIHIGKPEFKHTNDKVIITLYVFNQQLVNYLKKIRKIRGLNYLNMFNKNTNFKNKYYNKFKNEINLIPNFKNKIFILKNIYTKFFKELINLNAIYLNTFKYSFFKIEKLPLIFLIKNLLIKIKLYLRLKRIIFFNKSKFNSIHILPLKILLQRLYGKNVEFNIISLKDYHLNSSILTQIMAIKLKNRNNRLLRVVGRVLNFNIPFTRRLHYPAKKIKMLNKQNLIIRDYTRTNYFKLIPHVNVNNKLDLSKNNSKDIVLKKISDDKLNNLLKSIYPNEYTMNILEKNSLFIKKRRLVNTVLDKIKNKAVIGIRIEGSGRLSKRLIASRAVFKMKQIGTIKNMNSSFRGISSVLLRGNLNSNLNFSKSNNKTRIGAFGLKGWVSSY